MEKQCRGCLSTTSLFSWDEFVTEKITYADLFYRVTYFDRHLFPEMSFLCFECGDDILSIYHFIRKATEAEVKLKQEVYKKTLESMKVEVHESEQSALPDLSEILAQIDTSKITIKKIDLNEIVENEDLRQNPTFLNNLQTRMKRDKTDLGAEETFLNNFQRKPEQELSAEEEILVEDIEYQYAEEEVITDLGFEAVDIDVVEVDEPEQNNEAIQDEDIELQEIILDNLETEATNVEDKNDEKKGKRNKSGSRDCEYCGKRFSTSWSKNNHVMAIHGAKERSLCDECPRTFRDVWTLAKHKKTHDKNRKREYVCSQCDMTFLTSGSLKGHMELHDDNREKKFQCDQCDKAFFQKGALNVHKRLHTGQLIQCEWCEKRYPRVCDLEKHMLTHTGELPFNCKFCDKPFKYSSSLYTHMRREHFGYIYKCSYCSKQFEEKDDLIEHKMQHKLTPYRCALCNKECAKRMRLKNHIKFAHKIEDPDEVDQLVISNKPANKYRRMRKFINVQYDIPE